MREFFAEDSADLSSETSAHITTQSGQRFEIPVEDTVIRRYEAGDGILDHLIHFRRDGFLVLMANDKEMLESFDELEERGFKVERYLFPDDETMRMIVEVEF